MNHRVRRQSLIERQGAGLILVRGAGAGPGGVNPNFVYLTGLEAPAAALLLSSEGVRIGFGRKHPGSDYQRGRLAREILFLPPRDAVAQAWGEQGADTVDAVTAEAAGVDAVLPVGELEAVLAPALSAAPALHLVRGHPATLGGEDDPDTRFLDRVRRRFFGLRTGDATPVVGALRQAKDPDEVRAIERAVAVTAAALDRVCEVLRPGLREHEVEAEIARVYRAHGAAHGFEPIVGSGANALKLHYRDNAGPVEHGQLVLVDTGARLGHYGCDVTRTYPADGKFSGRQRRVYETVLEAQAEAIACCRPGTALGDVHARAFEVIERAGFGAHFVHGTAHHLGLETHDAGDPWRPLVAGAVITVEPGIYLAEESLGVRIEDDVLVTDDGPRLLTEAIPKTVEAIERRMAARAES